MTKQTLSCPHCDMRISVDPKGVPRSVPQLRRYMQLMRAAFANWPESNPRQFGDVEELRAFVQMKAGYREIAAQIPLVGLPRDKALFLVEASIRSTGIYAMPVLHGDTMVIFKPKSIAFSKLPHIAFCALNNAVDEVIRAETGLDPDQLLNETARAA